MLHSVLITLEYPPQHGGVANYYHGIAANWTHGKLQVLHVKLGRMWPHWLPIFFQILSRIYNLQPRIQLLQVGQVLPLGYVAVLVKWLYGIPYLVYTHGMDVLLPQRWVHKKWLLKFILKNAKLVVANSEFTKNEVVKLGISASKIVVVYPCVSLEGLAYASAELGFPPKAGTGLAPLESLAPAGAFRPTSNSPRAHMPTPLVPIFILTVSRLVARKGIDTVLASLPEVIKKVPNVQYVVIGDGPEFFSYKLQAISYQLEDHVQFLGALSDEEKIAWYKKASIFVLVPRPLGGDVEGFGLVYLEANSFGLPVIGSRTGGVPEAVIDKVNGLLVEPNNPHETSQALIQLLTDKALADTLGVRGLERVNKTFTWDTQLQKLHPYLAS